MKKICFLLIIGFPAFLLELSAQDTHTISGKIYLDKDKGDVYINLVDEETNKTPMEGVKQLILKPGENSIAFQIDDIPKGEYALKCFQDTNGNGKLDMGMFGPKEPWFLSWNKEKRFPPRWEDINFKLNGNKSFEITFE